MSSGTRTDEEIETEIQQCIKKMHDHISDNEKLAFYEGRLAALRWIRGRE